MNGLVVGALTITRQTVYGGFIDGLSIGLLALGVVLIYRSSRVINFAVGAMGALLGRAAGAAGDPVRLELLARR